MDAKCIEIQCKRSTSNLKYVWIDHCKIETIYYSESQYGLTKRV